MMRGHFLGFASIFIMGSSINMLYPIINNEITEKLSKLVRNLILLIWGLIKLIFLVRI